MPDKTYRILFAAYDKFPPFRVDVSVLFLKELALRNFKIDYLLQSEEDNKKFYVTKLFDSVAYVGATDNGQSIFHRGYKHILDILNDLRIASLTKKNKYDCIQVRDKFFASVFGLFIAKLRKLKFSFWLSYPFPDADLYSYHTGTARYPFLYLLRASIQNFLLYKIILPFSDHVFVQSDEMKLYFISKGFSQKKITPVPMGVDIEDIEQVMSNWENKSSHINNSIIYIGQMDKIRRIDFILHVFKRVLMKEPSAKLLLVGGSSDTSDIMELKELSNRLGVSHATTFTGHLPRQEALNYVKSADIGISPIVPNPIYNLSSPTKIIEYMLFSKPVVANKIADQFKIIDESNAGYCVEYNEDEFANAILKLLSEPKKAKKMGEYGKDYVIQKRNYKVLADLVANKYEKLLSSSS